MATSSTKKYFALAFGWVEMICFSGIIYGMNSLYESMKNEKLYIKVCNFSQQVNATNSTLPQSCFMQTKFYSYILITSMTSQCVLALPLGMFYDRYGLRVSKFFVSITFFLACSLFSLSFKYQPELAFVSGIFFGISAQILIIGNIALGRLFPARQNLIVSVQSGSVDSSAIMMCVFAFAHSRGVPLWISFLVFGIIALFIIACNATFMLKFVDDYFKQLLPLKKLEPSNHNGEILIFNETKEEHNSNDVTKTLLVDSKLEENGTVKVDPTIDHEINGNVEYVANNNLEDNIGDHDQYTRFQSIINKKFPNLRSIVLSRHYLMQLLFFSILYFRFTFFLVQINLQLSFNFENQTDLINKLMREMSYFFLCGIFISPCCGLIIEFSKRLTQSNSDDSLYNSAMKCFVPSQLLCSMCNFLLSITIIIPSITSVYLTYLFLILTRAFLFSLNSAYLLQAFPNKYFGKLQGITILTAGVVSFIQYGLLFKDLYQLNIVNYLLIGFSLFTFLHPLIIMFCNRS